MTAVAWDEPATRAALRRLRRRGLALVCAGLDALVVIVAIGNVRRSEPDLGNWLLFLGVAACGPLVYGAGILLRDVPRVRRDLQAHPWVSLPGRVRVVGQGRGFRHAVDLGAGGDSTMLLHAVSLRPFEAASGELWFAGDRRRGVVAVDRGGPMRRCSYPRLRMTARALEAPAEQEEEQEDQISRAGRAAAALGAVIGLVLAALWLRPWQVAESNPDLSHVATRTALARVVGDRSHGSGAPALQYVDFDGPHGPVRHVAVRVTHVFWTEQESGGTFFITYDLAHPRRVTVPGDSDEPLTRLLATTWVTLLTVVGGPLLGATLVGGAVEATVERRRSRTG